MKRNRIIRYAVGTALCLMWPAAGGIAAGAAEDKSIRSEYSYRRYTIADGLPDLITASVFQDSRGYIWAGTMRGFARFDGLRFKEFDSKGLSIVGFAERDSVVMAIGLLSSFCVGKDDSVTQVKMVQSVADSYQWHNSKTLPAGYGLYNTGGKKSLYAIADTGLVKVWEHELLDSIWAAGNLYWDRSNSRFIIPRGEDGVYFVNEDGTVDRHFDVKNITNFIPYGNSLRAVGYDGLYEYRDGELKNVFEYPFFNGESQDIQLLEDSEHRLLIRTPSRLYRYGDGTLEVVVNNLLPAYDMMVDNEGNIWIAAANGLSNYYKLNFKNHTLLPEGSVTQSLVIDKRDRLWLPANDGRIFRLENGTEKAVKYPASPAGFSFFEIGSIAHNNLLYISGGGGILRYDCDKDDFKWLQKLPPVQFEYISVLPAGNLLVAGNTNGALICDTTGDVKRIYETDELKQMMLTSFVDKQGNILLGGVKGITAINGDSIRFIFDERLEICAYMTYDRDGKLWLICRNRLLSMENDSVRVEHTFPKNLCNLHITRDGVMIVVTNDELYLSPDTR
ncbi:MAG: hypothetical protein LBJ47_00620, partial [Tannerella sp.]|nr:hypothetical protein [Tannerella sp.]